MCSPRVGGARPDRRRRRRQLRTARRPGGSRPRPGAPCSTVIPSATASGEANAATTSLIGPHGISAASSAASQSAVERVGEARRQQRSDAARPAARPGRRWSRSADRRPAPAAPSAAHSRGHCRSEPTATAIAPSAVANVSYGTMFGWALPSRPGATPVDERVLGLVDEAGEGRAEERDVDPLAARRRSRTPVALAPDQRGQDADRPEHPGHDIADRDADLGRAAAVLVRRAGDRHEPARGLDDEVVAGPVGGRADRPVAGDGEVDEARVQRARARRRRSRAARTRRPGSSRPGRRRRASSRRRTAAPSGCLRSSRMPRLLRLTAR